MKDEEAKQVARILPPSLQEETQEELLKEIRHLIEEWQFDEVLSRFTIQRKPSIE